MKKGRAASTWVSWNTFSQPKLHGKAMCDHQSKISPQPTLYIPSPGACHVVKAAARWSQISAIQVFPDKAPGLEEPETSYLKYPTWISDAQPPWALQWAWFYITKFGEIYDAATDNWNSITLLFSLRFFKGTLSLVWSGCSTVMSWMVLTKLVHSDSCSDFHFPVILNSWEGILEGIDYAHPNYTAAWLISNLSRYQMVFC